MTLPKTWPTMNVGIANTIPKIKPTNNATTIFWVNKDIAKEKMKNALNTTIVAHFVLASLNSPVRSSCLYINLALIEFSEGIG